MTKKSLNRGHQVPVFVDRFGSTILNFKAKVIETRNLKHTVGKGDAREEQLASFVNELLPNVYVAEKGEVVDLKGRTSPQFDVLIYDRTRNFPFHKSGTISLPAEALLASIEVKSELNSEEIRKSQSAVEKLRALRPFKRPPAQSGAFGQDGEARYFHTLFAYSTNLKGDDWATRLCDNIEKCSPTHCEGIEMVYVLGKGLLRPASRKLIPENEQTSQALIAYWISIFNFLGRENARRGPVPYFSYAPDLNKFWRKV